MVKSIANVSFIWICTLLWCSLAKNKSMYKSLLEFISRNHCWCLMLRIWLPAQIAAMLCLLQLYSESLFFYYRQFNITGILLITINSLSCFYEIRFFCFKNIGHIFLRVAVNNRKSGTLNLYHNTMTGFESVVNIVQVNHKFFGFTRC